MRVKRFHQFVRYHKGPVNTAIIDLFTGHIYQVENEWIEKFESRKYDEIEGFLHSLEMNKLIIEVDETTWIPALDIELDEKENVSLIIEIEEGAALSLIKRFFKDYRISRVLYYGEKRPQDIFNDVEIIQKEKDFNHCIELATQDGELKKISESGYHLSKIYNPCWGRKVAIHKDHTVSPCIYSKIVCGHMNHDDVNIVLERLKQYWSLTKDRVERCRECELRYVCFDCREIAYRATGNISGPNPHCTYDPRTGKWANQRL
jgi:radical SAM protein with 4Fe4S-binding SPASM domain